MNKNSNTPPHNPKKNQLAHEDTSFLSRQELLPIRLMLELTRPELILNERNIHRGLLFLGSARIPTSEVLLKKIALIEIELTQNPNNIELQKDKAIAERMLKNSAYLKEATQLAHLASTHSDDWVVFSGGGPGFMEAANRGAHQSKYSVSCHIDLPSEENPNPWSTPELTFQFKYFSIRKMHLLMRARAVVAFPGGFGTLDELFEILTLLQTNKIKPLPIVLFNKTYWERIINFQALVEEGTISERDLQFFNYAETAEAAWEYIQTYTE